MEKVREVGKSNHCVNTGPFVPDLRICVGQQGETLQGRCCVWEGDQLLECEVSIPDQISRDGLGFGVWKIFNVR